VRCTCNEVAAAEGLAQIVPRSPVPIVADIHFHVEMASRPSKPASRDCVSIPATCESRGDKARRLRGARPRRTDSHRRERRQPASRHLRTLRWRHARSLVESARLELAYFEEVGFDDVKIS